MQMLWQTANRSCRDCSLAVIYAVQAPIYIFSAYFLTLPTPSHTRPDASIRTQTTYFFVLTLSLARLISAAEYNLLLFASKLVGLDLRRVPSSHDNTVGTSYNRSSKLRPIFLHVLVLFVRVESILAQQSDQREYSGLLEVCVQD